VIRITVEYLFPIGLTDGQQPLEIELRAGSSVGDLLALLLEKYGEDIRSRLVQKSDGAPFVTFLVNGEQAALEQVLAPEDNVLIVPPIAGG
jgi:molybdopterin converting factor small subunit